MDVPGGGAANHFCYDYHSVDAIMVPAVCRVVSPFTGGPFIAGLTTIFLLDYISLMFHST